MLRLESDVSRGLSTTQTAANRIECFGSVAFASLLLTLIQTNAQKLE